jgi:hypothetical protein
MNKQQTSVEWLVYVVQSNIAPNYIPKEIVEQAKEMEKEQIIDAYEKGDKYKLEISGEQYYNETFNK